MKKLFKSLFKLMTAIISIGGALYLARDQVKEIIEKVRELLESKKLAKKKDDSNDIFDDDIDTDDNMEDIFSESAKDSRDYFTINITEEDTEEKEDVTEVK